MPSDNVSREVVKELIREHVMTSSSEHRELQASVDALIVASEAAAKKTGSKAMQASADSLRKYRANLERELRDDCPPAWEKLRAWVQLVRDDWNHAGYIMKACAADYILDWINILSPAPAEAAQRVERPRVVPD